MSIISGLWIEFEPEIPTLNGGKGGHGPGNHGGPFYFANDCRSSESCTSVSDVVMSSPVKCETATSLRAPQPSKVAASFPLSALINIGKLISPKISQSTVVFEEFNLQDKLWLPRFEVKVSLDQKPFASGSFRVAYKASVISGLPSSNADGYLVKGLKEDQVYEIERFFGTVEALTRKMVLMNSLARNFALQINVP